MTTLADELQRTLGDAYTLLHELGGGGMSTVYVAQDNGLRRRVVVKVLPQDVSAGVSVERFKREIMLAAALQHPNIVPVLIAGESFGRPFFIMPFVDGESLRRRLSRGPLSVRETVSIMKDVARALGYAHGRSIIHRDIKPDNILLAASAATVTDFGVAKAIVASRHSRDVAPTTRSAITTAGSTIGTPAYMAPEQAAGDPATDHRADVYALGIVAYEMLIGAPPFHSRSPQQLLAAQLTEHPTPIGTRRYDVPRPLDRLITRMLEKDPAARPNTASEVARALESPEILSGPVAAHPAGRRGWGRRVALAFLAVLLLIGLGAGGVYLVQWLRSAPARTTTAAAAAPTPVVILPFFAVTQDSVATRLADQVNLGVSQALAAIPTIQIRRQADSSGAGAGARSPLLVAGSVVAQGGRFRVMSRLVNVADGRVLWSGTFGGRTGDLDAIQAEVVQGLSDAIRAH